ncbi:protein ACTIVITY OF BC1 COMPLEX KINASE 8, chloroplastic [Durio zibethinus]|uniref:Protein ACTIVITY OF BC1 COMPLEX KINASE 8, chloroplastic n=1 Tax=Durio zibethinus TaxID=66656 RepID=A0A6P5YIG2_DURZI|nr:protein ACTIVITY OF BC1 COMPLEX KINASE 8, chloroplastic [Durio zibethinus]XP_022740137.1 protein ACTIVITY OF BC1 COMPLEX KINASE 8, chloroplastic [Durio zibethinus]XP_022740138.1 protein ACTIVITY OF BC1 COMPLEX KINASE 8, chloroplastic [Durio zibethinus]
MASISLSLQNIQFLSPRTTSKHLFYLSRCSSFSTVSLAGNSHLRNVVVLRSGIRALKEEGVAYEEWEQEYIKELNGNGTASKYDYDNGSVKGFTNGGVGLVESESNGSLVKYVNGNGNGTAAAATATAAEVVVVEEEGVDSEEVRKKRVEEIGKEEAWFKSSTQEQVEVSVASGGRWNRFKTYSTIQRTLEIWGFVITFIFKAWLNNQKFSYRGGMTEEKKVLRRKALAKWLKESILRLGPTFIKIGQQFSTRVDILAQEYVDQLSELQDQVPPFPSATALSIVEEELGGPVDDIFDRFDYEPIAAASLGQVHRARLKGQEVVIKVQRPGLKDLFDIDLKNLRVIAEYLQKIDPKSDGAKRDWVAIYDECASVLYQEIDYAKEAANAELFATNFKEMDYVKVPTIYWEYTTPQVLTMEYVPGIKINKIQALDQLGVDRKRLGRYAVESYLEQILSHGFFHADPHPGNIAVDDVNGGRLIFYDFGMMGSISSNIREGLLEAFYGVYEKDPDKVLQAMIQMGVLVPTGDMTAVRRTAQFFLNSFEERLAAQRREREMATTELGFKKPLTKEEKIEKKKQRLAAIGEDLLAIAADQPFRFPATFTFVVRAFSVLDGIGKGLDPRFDITEIAKPYALELLRFREAGVEVILKDFKKRWDKQSRAFSNLFRQADRVQKLAETIQRLEQGDLKLRVRTLESERAFQRVAAVQKTLGSAVAAGSLINLATILYLNSVRVPAVAAYIFCAFFSFQVLIGIIKVKKLDQRERLITGTT